jgi:putative transposase
MLKTHKITLDPNQEQIAMLHKCFGISRKAYNWALEKAIEIYKNGSITNQFELRKLFNQYKKSPDVSYILEVSKCVPQESIINLGVAFDNFFSKRANHPVFKKKGLHDSFKISSGFFKVVCKKIRIPKIGYIKMFESLRFEGHLVSVTISRKANRYFAAIHVECEDSDCFENKSTETIGVDVGVRQFALSNEIKFDVPQNYKEVLEKIKRLQVELSRKIKDSHNYLRLKEKIGILYLKLKNIREDFLHKVTTQLARNYASIAIEDLDVKSMMQNEYYSKSVANACFYTFRTMLKYKTKKFGSTLFEVNRYFASSKQCCICNYKLEELPLNIREWTCPNCLTLHDRDINAAINLKKQAESSPVLAVKKQNQ